MMGRTHVTEPGLWQRSLVFVVSMSMALVANALFMPANPASANQGSPSSVATPSVATPSVATPSVATPSVPKPGVVDADSLTPQQLTDQVNAANALRAALMKSSADVAATNAR